MRAIDISDIRSTIVPKSDQMNFEDLIAGPRTITLTDVRPGSEDQPLILHYSGDEGHPYKPNKTWRKALAFAWGADARAWIGRSLTLAGDPTVKWAGVEVGGIIITHMTHIPQALELKLSATRGKRVLHRVAVLAAPDVDPSSPTLQQVLDAIAAANDKAGMQHAKQMAMDLINDDDVLKAQEAYSARVAALKASA